MVRLPQPCSRCGSLIYNYSLSCGNCGHVPIRPDDTDEGATQLAKDAAWVGSHHSITMGDRIYKAVLELTRLRAERDALAAQLGEFLSSRPRAQVERGKIIEECANAAMTLVKDTYGLRQPSYLEVVKAIRGLHAR